MTSSTPSRTMGAAVRPVQGNWTWIEPVAWLCLAMLVISSFRDLPARHFMSPFREGQTALLTDQLAKGRGGEGWPSLLATPTPVFGYPWNVPMEFPLYQRIVAGLESATGWPLDLLGRIVNAMFTIGAFILAGSLGRRAGLGQARVRLLVLLGLMSPLYFGYGGAFMIEGCALCLAIGWIWMTVRCWEGRAVWPWLLAAACSAAAGLVKPTTWAPAAVGIATMVVVGLAQPRSVAGAGRPWGRILGTVLIMGLTVWLVKAWVDYSDVVKARNPLAAGLASANLHDWNYGTWAQKFSPVVWLLVGGKTMLLTFGLVGLVLPIGAAWWWRHVRNAAATVRSPLLPVVLVAAVSAPLVFTNLHLQHDYYQFANGLYLWAALALGVAGLDAAGRAGLADRLLAVVLASCVLTTAGYVLFRKGLRDPADEAVLTALQKLPPGRPVAYLGFDYSGKLPYYSERPALMSITQQDVASGRVTAALELNRNLDYGAVVVGGPAYIEAGWQAASVLGLVRPTMIEVFPRTMLIVPAAEAGKQQALAGTGGNISPELAAVIAEAKGTPSGFHRIAWERTAAGTPCGVQILLKRRDQLFWFRSRNLTLTRIKAVD